MKIAYVAKHNSGANDDEGAIHYALTAIGHTVIPIQENNAAGVARMARDNAFDLLLFHKWYAPEILTEIKQPKMFWCFDLVDHEDDELAATLTAGDRRLTQWMQDITPLVELGFCTDGDWVRRDQSGKLVQLMQGADERYVGRTESSSVYRIPIMFPGTEHNRGRARTRWITDMRLRYRKRFEMFSSGVYREALSSLIADCGIVMAPPGPATDHYWSNRVYVVLGYAGFMLHPYCEALTNQYLDGAEIVYYTSPRCMHASIEFYLKHPDARQKISERALQRTASEHLYRHRCATLIETVKQRLL